MEKIAMHVQAVSFKRTINSNWELGLMLNEDDGIVDMNGEKLPDAPYKWVNQPHKGCFELKEEPPKVDNVTEIIQKAQELHDLIIPLRTEQLKELDERTSILARTTGRKDMFVAISNIARFEWLYKVLT